MKKALLVGVVIAMAVPWLWLGETGKIEQPKSVPAPISAPISAEQACVNKNGTWEEKPWPFSGYFCSLPQKYDCDLQHIRIAAEIQVRSQYRDKTGQRNLDRQMGRRGDYNAMATEDKSDQYAIDSTYKKARKLAQEYMEHSECTRDREIIRGIAERE